MNLATLTVAAISIGITGPAGQAPWRTYDLKPVRLSIQLPAKPLERKLGLKESVDTVESTRWFAVQTGEFAATLSYSVYVRGVPASAQGAVDGALAALQQSRPALKMKRASKPIAVNGVKGFKVFASLGDGSDRIVYESMVFAKNRSLWQIGFTYSATPNNAAMAAKALKSLKLTP